MRFRRTLTTILSVGCLIVAASAVYALTMTSPRSDNCQIGVGTTHPGSDNDYAYRSQVPPSGGGDNNHEEVSFEVEVCCTDCNAGGGSGTCGTGNCTPAFTANYTVNLKGGGTATVSDNHPPILQENCPLCVTYTESIVLPLSGTPPGRSTSVTINNIIAACVCCAGANQGVNMWSGHAFTFSRELTDRIDL